MFSSLSLGSLFLVSYVSGDCTSDCNPVTGETDCCDYYTDVTYAYCQDMENTEYYDNCDTEIETTSTSNATNSMFDCSLNWDVDFVGKSGQFKLYPCDDSNFFIKVKLERIQEYNSNGNKINSNKVTSFAYASAEDATYESFNHSVYQLSDSDGNDVTLGGVTLDYYFNVDGTLVTFLMNLYLIDDITILEYTNGNETYTETLSQGTLKFDYTIENWPFQSDDNSLEIEVKLTTGGTTNDASNDGSNGGSTQFSWGNDFVVNVPETYEHTNANGTVTAKDVDIDVDTTGSGKQATVTFLFLNAGDAHTIMYDPTIAEETDSDNNNKNSANSINLSLNFAFIALVSIIFANLF